MMAYREAGEGGGSHEEPRWLGEIRLAARDRFEGLAWPAPTEEEWRRSDLSRLDLDTRIRSAGPGGGPGGASAPRSACLVTARIPEALRAKGLRLLPMEVAAREQAGVLESILSRATSEIANRFEAWNLAAWTGSLLWVPPGLESTEPIIVETRVAGLLCQPRLLVVVGEGSRVVVLHHILGEAPATDPGLAASEPPASRAARASTGTLVNAAVDLRLEAGAGLRLFESQDLAPSTSYIRNLRSSVARDADLYHLDVQLGADFVKSRLSCSLEGSGADLRLDGLWHCLPGQHLDLRTVQLHGFPRSTSRTLYKGAVEGGGSSVFQGLIEVAEGAAGTDAFLANRNLILGDAARADSLPTLRIGNNDVRCSHGSTTGRLSEDELFYLESRGLPRSEARELIVTGYFEDLVAAAPPEFAEALLARLRERLRSAAVGSGKAA